MQCQQIVNSWHDIWWWFANPTIGDNIIQFIAIASTGNAQTFGDIGSDNKAFGGNGVCCNATRALFGGGGPLVTKLPYPSSDGNNRKFMILVI